jgi:hypothetical protein
MNAASRLLSGKRLKFWCSSEGETWCRIRNEELDFYISAEPLLYVESAAGKGSLEREIAMIALGFLLSAFYACFCC